MRYALYFFFYMGASTYAQEEAKELFLYQKADASLKVQESSFSQPSLKKEKKILLLYKNAIRRGHVQDPEFRWDWGHRNGIEFGTTIKHWSFTATHAKFYTKYFASRVAETGRTIPIWKSLETKYPQNSWRLHLNTGDIEVGRFFLARKNVFLRPHVGCRAMWSQQKHALSRRLLKGEAPLLYANQCAGIGMRSGIDSGWNIGERLSLFSDGAVSFLTSYGNGHKTDLSNQTTQESLGGITMAEFSLGVQYEKFLFSAKKMTARIGYELHHIFHQHRLLQFLSPGEADPRTKGISLQGMTIGLRLEF